MPYTSGIALKDPKTGQVVKVWNEQNYKNYLNYGFQEQGATSQNLAPVPSSPTTTTTQTTKPPTYQQEQPNAKMLPGTESTPAYSQEFWNNRPAQPTATPPATTSTYQPTLIEIASARPDVMATAKAQGGDPFTAGTAANTWLNDWYNRTGKAEGADMVAKGVLKPTTSGGATAGGETGVVAGGTTGGATGGETGETTGGETTDDYAQQFKDYISQLEKTQKESQAKTEQLFKEMGENTTTATMEKFQEMQKGLQESYKTYFDEQSKYLEELKNQPSAVENLQKFREQQGLLQMEAELANVDKTILDTEGLLLNIEADIRKRTEGLPVSEAAARRLTAMEQKPLTKQLDELLRSRQRVAAGLEAKQATVTQFMQAQSEDVKRQKEISEAKLGISKEQYGFQKDIATQSFDLFTTLQTNLNKVNELKFTQIGNEADYKNKLAEAGFDFFTQMRAEQIASKQANTTFENELLKIKFENDLKNANPNFDVQIIEGDNKQVYSISKDKNTGKSTVTDLGQIGAGEKTTYAPSSERKLYSELGGQAGTGMTFNDWYNSQKGRNKYTEDEIQTAMIDSLNSDNKLGADNKVSWETYVDMMNTWYEYNQSMSGFESRFPKDRFLDFNNRNELDNYLNQ